MRWSLPSHCRTYTTISTESGLPSPDRPSVHLRLGQRLRTLFRRPRLMISLLVFALLVLAYFLVQDSHKRTYMLLHSPPHLHPYIKQLWPVAEAGEPGPPRDVPELYNARWAGSWDVPRINPLPSQAHHGASAQTGPRGVWVALYIFSTPHPSSRARRDLIRRHHPLDTLPPHLANLVSVKFVIGYPSPSADSDPWEELREANRVEEALIRAEQELHGDLVRLDGLVNGDNMDEGKTFEWIKYAGSEGNEAQWIFKCDDDTFLLLPNLLDVLLELDPSKPTYIGRSMPHWPHHLWYNTGPLYGVSWGIARTLSTSGASKDWYTWPFPEDALFGEMMYLLPPKPPCSTAIYPSSPPPDEIARPRRSYPPDLQTSPPPAHCLPTPIPYDTPPPGGWSSPPLSPDPRTGLVRVELDRQMGSPWLWWSPRTWWVKGPGKVIAWHPVKEDLQYISSYYQTRDWFIRHRGKYEWMRPAGWEEKLRWAENRDDGAGLAANGLQEDGR